MDTWKSPAFNVCPHGLTIHLVDGTFLRSGDFALSSYVSAGQQVQSKGIKQ